MISTHQDTMCSTQTRLLPSLALVLTLAVGIYGGGIGKCNSAGGTCIVIPTFLRVDGDPFCHKTDQITVTKEDLEDEGCDSNAICCLLNKVQYVAGRRKCDADQTPKRCTKRHGGICQNDCDTIKIDGLCKGGSCTCCVQKAKKCEPKEEYADKEGAFCVSKPKHCKKSGGIYVNKGCDCKKEGAKAHLCYPEKPWHWSYEDEGAPEFWKDYFPLCGLERQSPIDIISADAVQEKVTPFEFSLYDEKPASVDVQNNGHSAVVYWNNAEAPSVSGGDLPSEYILAQFHFHWGSDSTKGSEHLLEGKAFPIEAHLVHYKKEYGSLGGSVAYGDGLAVLGVMFEIGEENAALKPLVDQLPNILEADTEVNIPYDMDLNGFLPSNKDSFYRYLGSLTTPSCNEAVVWTVFKEPLQISEEQLEAFRKLNDAYDHHIVDNFRPPQPLNGRTVTEFNK